jgi:uncharacterized protein YbjT (DUF2867 family)
MPASVLVTGASGNVGAPLVRELVQRGLTVRAAVRDVDDVPAPNDASDETGAVTRVEFDFTDPSTYDAALEGADRLFLVRPPAISDVKAHINPFVDAAVAAGVEHVVVLSLLGAERNPVVPHRGMEQHVLEVGVDYTLLRPSFFMQNLSTTHREDIKEHGEIFVPAGRGATSFIDARDIAAVAAEALTDPAHRNHAYPITGAEALTYEEVAAVFTDVLDRPITYPNPGLWAFAQRMREHGHPAGFIAVMTGIYTTCRLGLADTVTPDAERILGRPPTSLRTFVEDYRDVWA